MSWLEALILGVIQGLTEFLPVSSSGHLELAGAILDDSMLPEEGLLMSIILHGATALSTIVVFRKDVMEMLRGIIKWQWNEEMKFAFKVGISMIPAGIIGLFFEEQIQQLFGGQVLLVGFMLLVTGTLLFIADLSKTTDKGVGFRHSFIIGVAQAVALLPGISRAGATISMSVMLGIDRARAARFSFLMVVPLILGKVVLDLFSGNVSDSTLEAGPLAVGFVTAFVFGVMACKLMIALVRKAKLKYFSFYCYAVGLTAIALMVF